MSHHDDFKRGYIDGYRAGAGRNTTPPIPPTPPDNGTPMYDVGYSRGLEAGKKVK